MYLVGGFLMPNTHVWMLDNFGLNFTRFSNRAIYTALVIDSRLLPFHYPNRNGL